MQGDNVTVNELEAYGKISATAGKNFTSLLKIRAKDIDISAGDDVLAKGHGINAQNALVLTANNIKTSGASSIHGRRNATLTAKNAINVNKINAGKLTLSAKNNIDAREVSVSRSIKATSTAGAITLDSLRGTGEEDFNAAKGVNIKSRHRNYDF